MRINKKGFSFVEYGLMLAVIAASLFSMQIYLKRGIQGRLRAGGESISESSYSPGKVTSTITTTIRVHTEEGSTGALNTATTDESITRDIDETITRKK